MSTSPTRFYASRRNSRDTSRPSSPPSTAEVRSAAIAKLKRAASLPRTPAGGRPAQVSTTTSSPSSVHDIAGPSTLTPTYPSLAHPVASPSPSDIQEILSPSPVQEHFDHAAIYASPPPSALSMQRSASASSSYHMPTPNQLGYNPLGTPYYSPSPGNTPDWAAMQLAHSYLPSLSPAGIHAPPFQQLHPGAGRNTPSPLPSLGELRTLQRSNSAMARAHAMSKLTGGRNTPSDEDHTLHPVHPGLVRADTLNPSKMLGVSQPAPEVVTPAEEEESAATAAALPRPRLQRSFTVSSSNMGEERRSAVGRRMVARLGERKVARQQEEDEVRQLWEERRAAAENREEQGGEGVLQPEDRSEGGLEHGGIDQGHHAGEHDGQFQHSHHEEADHYDDQERYDDQGPHGDDHRSNDHGHQNDGQGALHIPQDTLPVFQRTSPAASPMPDYAVHMADDSLGVPDRPTSRGTMRSEAFEYDNLRRSLSSRTARKEMGIVEAVPKVDHPSNVSEVDDDEEEEMTSPGIHQALEEPLPLPRPQYATPSRHVAKGSTSTNGTLQGGHSPGDSIMSRDALGSMMFVMGGTVPTPGSGKSGEQWPSEVEEHGSDWGTPARDHRELTFGILCVHQYSWKNRHSKNRRFLEAPCHRPMDRCRHMVDCHTTRLNTPRTHLKGTSPRQAYRNAQASCRGKRLVDQRIKLYPSTRIITKNQEACLPNLVERFRRQCANDPSRVHPFLARRKVSRPVQKLYPSLYKTSAEGDQNLPCRLVKLA